MLFASYGLNVALRFYLFFGCETAVAQKGVDFRFVAAEFHVKFHRVGAAAHLKHVFEERFCSGGVKHSFFLE